MQQYPLLDRFVDSTRNYIVHLKNVNHISHYCVTFQWSAALKDRPVAVFGLGATEIFQAPIH